MIFYPRQISLALIHFALLYEPFMIHDDDDDGCTGFQEKPIKRTSQPFLPFLPYFIFSFLFDAGASLLVTTSFIPHQPSRPSSDLRWEFIKENKKVRKQEKKKENKNSTKKVIKKNFFFIFFFVEFLFS